MTGNKTALKLLGLAALLAFPVLPFSSEYVMHVAVLIMVYAVLAMGLNVLPGFCNLLDLGYVGFYGIGAYTAGILALNHNVSFWLIVPGAIALGALCGMLRGAPTLRLSGDYFAIVTFGFTELVVLFLTNEIWLTRGPLGLPGIPPIALSLEFLGIDWRYDFLSEIPYYYLGLAMVGAVYVVMCRIEDSRLGRAWLAIKEDPLAAASCGINLMAYKTVAFAFSAGVGALAGCFMAQWSMFLAPDVFKFWESFLVLCMIVLGGLGNINGAIVGAVVLIALGEVLRVLLPKLGLPAETRFLVYGLIMILIMRFKPGGFFPTIAATSKKSRLILDLKARLQAERAG
ncbi:branched-chain amino acid ABC transporter permease [Fundidesulfovibrio agrisoli]|uniref:branched-chain amino acid ABC transporter permease n=1 Tax=Fundidesulfovibrio agrisoli TaxID=2922717 RepID=UPI001FADE359|nr:branched-chain amino acid ABC transporter permease [Fundidesulfovibrio agrisoli]